MGADLGIAIEYGPPDFEWALFCVTSGVLYRGPIEAWIQDGIEVPVEWALDSVGAYSKYKHRLPNDASMGIRRVLREDADGVYWIRVCSGDWWIQFVDEKRWQKVPSGPTYEFDPEPDLEAPIEFTAISALCNELYARGCQVRLYIWWGQ
jgi:hypothetical protein